MTHSPFNFLGKMTHSPFKLYRFGSIPDILELDHLTVSGDVTFGRGVSLRVSLSFQSR